MTCENINALQRSFYTLEVFRPVANDLDKITLMLQTAPLPGIAMATFKQPTTLSTQIPVPTNSVAFDPLSVQFKVDTSLENWQAIFDWIADMTNIDGDCPVDGSAGDDIDYSLWHGHAILTVLNHQYEDFRKYRFENVVPTRLAGIDFSSILNQGEDVICNVVFDYSYHKRMT